MSFWRRTRETGTDCQLFVVRFAFCCGILLMVAVGLKIIFHSSVDPRVLDYEVHLSQIDGGNVENANFVRSKDGTTIEGKLPESSETFKARIADHEIEDLTARLKSEGVSAGVAHP